MYTEPFILASKQGQLSSRQLFFWSLLYIWLIVGSTKTCSVLVQILVSFLLMVVFKISLAYDTDESNTRSLYRIQTNLYHLTHNVVLSDILDRRSAVTQQLR